MKREAVTEWTNGGAEKEIIRLLEQNTAAGRRCWEVFRDFVTLAEDALAQIPAHAKSAVTEKKLATDPPEMQERWKRIADYYKSSPHYWQNFGRAIHILFSSTTAGTEPNWWDTIGNVYMQFAYPNPGTGQYFTPFHLAAVMARCSIGRGEIVYDRLNEAVNAAGLGELVQFNPDTPLAARYFYHSFGGLIAKHYKPVLVQDPCCGSGVMFLATASCLPPWMTQLGLVQFFGQDLDGLCVQMAQVNLSIYGLNGQGLKWALALSGAELARVPEPLKTDYAEAKAALDAGDVVKVQAVQTRVKKRQSAQLSLEL